MAPKYGERSLSPLAKELRNEIQEEQFDRNIPDPGNGRIDVDEAAAFAARKIEEAREVWDEDNADRIQAPTFEMLKIQEATKRTTVRWRYGSGVAISFMVLIAVAGLTATGH